MCCMLFLLQVMVGGGCYWFRFSRCTAVIAVAIALGTNVQRVSVDNLTTLSCSRRFDKMTEHALAHAFVQINLFAAQFTYRLRHVGAKTPRLPVIELWHSQAFPNRLRDRDQTGRNRNSRGNGDSDAQWQRCVKHDDGRQQVVFEVRFEAGRQVR